MENMVINDVKNILSAREVRIVERLLGGMSNYTYVVWADGFLYTFRVPGEYSENFVNRIYEKDNIKLMERLNITNNTLYLNLDDGKKLAKYVEGKPLSTIDPADYPYQEIASVLKQIHNSSLRSENDYQPFARLAHYEKIIRDLNFLHPTSYQTLKTFFLDNYQKYLESQSLTLTHGDSQPSNFVLGENQLLVVDFEFCGNNDPLYDLACFANKRYEDGLKLLDYYFDHQPSIDEQKRFHLWRCFQCFQWYNVAIFKELKGMSQTLKIDFQKVAIRYLELISFYLEKVDEINKKE